MPARAATAREAHANDAMIAVKCSNRDAKESKKRAEKLHKNLNLTPKDRKREMTVTPKSHKSGGSLYTCFSLTLSTFFLLETLTRICIALVATQVG